VEEGSYSERLSEFSIDVDLQADYRDDAVYVMRVGLQVVAKRAGMPLE